MGKNLTLEEIYAMYAKDLYRYVFSLCKNESQAEDIVQETFYRAYFYVETFQEGKIKPWLFKVAYHTFIDLYRKEKKLTYYANSSQLEYIKMVRSSEDEFLVSHQIDEWFAWLDTLPLQQRSAVILRDYYYFSYVEIAEMLDLTLAKVKVTIFRGRKALQEIMIREGSME